MPSVAEYLCQRCGAVDRSGVPGAKRAPIESCGCGGTRQIVRIYYESNARAGSIPFPFAWVPSLHPEHRAP